jgi:hypothetical protein
LALKQAASRLMEPKLGFCSTSYCRVEVTSKTEFTLHRSQREETKDMQDAYMKGSNSEDATDNDTEMEAVECAQQVARSKAARVKRPE